MTAPVQLARVSVVMQKTSLANRWSSFRWEPVSVAVCRATDDDCDGNAHGALHPDAARISRLPTAGSNAQWRFDNEPLELHRTEAEGYYLNLAAPDPKVFVMWRMLEPEALMPGGPEAAPFVGTVSYNEAARMLDGGEQVDAVPLPSDIREWMEAFVQAHYKPEPRRKVRRRDPIADAGGGSAEDANRS
ncbi:MAG: DUF3305 domain-containing protein [Pseudomonadota bacterium]|nr:DUF3305 domain-containing protein [Pseudomonadota bacterium]